MEKTMIEYTEPFDSSLGNRGATQALDLADAPGSGTPQSRCIVSVSPFRCRIWALHDRLDEFLTEESCRSEIASVAAHGQLVPALGRPLRDDPDHDVEMICGARRLFVARHLGLPVRVELREMSDREAIAAMDAENRIRKDISPYERGLSYASLLRARYFSSQEDIARALKVSASQVSRLLKLAELPSIVVAAFESPLDIREGWGLDLHKAWHDTNFRSILSQRARSLAVRAPRLKAHEVYERLLAPVGETARQRRKSIDDVVKGSTGKPLFRIRHQRNTLALIVPNSVVRATSLDMIRGALVDILERTVESRGAPT
jgi:ParB family transcriptional regulator, chromosome partitioning protein